MRPYYIYIYKKSMYIGGWVGGVCDVDGSMVRALGSMTFAVWLE